MARSTSKNRSGSSLGPRSSMSKMELSTEASAACSFSRIRTQLSAVPRTDAGTAGVDDSVCIDYSTSCADAEEAWQNLEAPSGRMVSFTQMSCAGVDLDQVHPLQACTLFPAVVWSHFWVSTRSNWFSDNLRLAKCSASDVRG